MKKIADIGVPIGGSLIMTIFVILCLVTFAALSFVSADNDNNLSVSTADTTENYYEKEGEANDKLKVMDETLQGYYAEAGSEGAYYNLVSSGFSESDGYKVESVGDETFITYTTQVNENEELISKIKVMYPTTAEDSFIMIEGWTLEYTAEWESTTELPVLQ